MVKQNCRNNVSNSILGITFFGSPNPINEVWKYEKAKAHQGFVGGYWRGLVIFGKFGLLQKNIHKCDYGPYINDVTHILIFFEPQPGPLLHFQHYGLPVSVVVSYSLNPFPNDVINERPLTASSLKLNSKAGRQVEGN